MSSRRGFTIIELLVAMVRFLIVSVVGYGANVGLLALLVSSGIGKVGAQALAILLVTPFNFLGNRLWSFRSTRPIGPE